MHLYNTRHKRLLLTRYRGIRERLPAGVEVGSGRPEKLTSQSFGRGRDMDAIDITALRHFITQRRDAVWEGLDVCPRTCPSVGARLCTYAAWFARPPHKHARSLLDLPLSSRCMQTLFRFRMGVHRLPKDEGSWNRVPRHERLCLLCNLGSLCDEKHVVFECSALQGLRDEYASLFSDVCTMKQFLWQDDLVSVAKFIHACLDKMFSCETGLSNDSQASDQPDVAGRDVT